MSNWQRTMELQFRTEKTSTLDGPRTLRILQQKWTRQVIVGHDEETQHTEWQEEWRDVELAP